MKCLSGYDFCNSAVTNTKAVVASTPYANTCYEAELGYKKEGEREIDCHVNSVATPRVVTGTHVFTTQVCSSLVNAQKAVNGSKVKHTNSSHHFPLVIDSEHYYTNKSTPNKEEMRADVTSVEDILFFRISFHVINCLYAAKLSLVSRGPASIANHPG